MTYTEALPREDLWLGEMRACRIAGRRVLLLCLESGIYAYEDRCAHLGISLSDGTLRAGVLTCAAHGFQYDARTGVGINPRHTRLVALPVRVDEGHICVALVEGQRSGCPLPQPANESHCKGGQGG